MSVVTETPDAVSITTSYFSGGDGAATPTTTETEEALGGGGQERRAIRDWLRESELVGSAVVTRRADPRAGDVFLLIDKARNRALACHGGRLRLEDVSAMDSEKKPIPGCWQWLCTEKNGFRGFQNVAGGGFLGHDIWWDFYANVPHHKGWECFSFTRHEGGYYWIQALNWWTHWQVSARPDGRGLSAQREGGTLWEFVKVHQ